MLDFELFGDDAGMHHLTNLIFHILNTILLYWVIHQMTGRPWRSAVVAVIFALHPINVESVAWVTERNNLLSTFLGLITLLLYAQYSLRQSRACYYSALLAYLMCLMAKPILVTLPFLLLLLDYWPLRRFILPEIAKKKSGVIANNFFPEENHYDSIRKCIVEKIPFLALAFGAILFSLLRFGDTISTHSVPITLRISNATVSYVKYLWLLLWPADLAAFYPFPKEIPIEHLIGSIVFIAGFTVYGYLKRNVAPYLIIGWLWFLGTLVPKIGLVQAGLWPEMADRWAYFPAIGIFILVMWWCGDVFSRRPVILRVGVGLAVGAYIVVLSTVTYLQVGYWANSTALFERMIDKTDNNYMAHNNLGYILIKEKRYDEAQQHFEKAIAIFPRFEIPYLNLGSIAKSRGQTDSAIEWYIKALDFNPRFARAYLNLGNIYFEREAFSEAIGYFTAGIQVDPNSALLYNSLGAALTRIGRLTRPSCVSKRHLRSIRGLKWRLKISPRLRLPGTIPTQIYRHRYQNRCLGEHRRYGPLLGQTFCVKARYPPNFNSLCLCINS